MHLLQKHEIADKIVTSIVLPYRRRCGVRGPIAVTDRAHLDLDNYLPYLLNRVGFALVSSFTASALAQHDLTIDMWRVLAALSNRGELRQVDLSTMTSIEAST